MVKETKKMFLRRLGRALFWRLPSGEVRAIVEDYSGFFDDRMTCLLYTSPSPRDS